MNINKVDNLIPTSRYITVLKSDLETSLRRAYQEGYKESSIESGSAEEVIFVSESRDEFDPIENYIFSRKNGVVIEVSGELANALYDTMIDIGLNVRSLTYEMILGETLARDFINEFSGRERKEFSRKFPEYLKEVR